VPVLRALAAQAVAMFPFLANVAAVRAYRGYRPDTPDRLPIIGPDPWITGLFHACGHQGSGVCLAPATGALTAELLTAEPVAAAPFAFDPERFG
jgi:glycine/D-amino acid oxidase-like deaminating enzyme